MKRAAPVTTETNATVVAKARAEGRIGAGAALSHPFDQDEFEAEAVELAAKVGFAGEPEWEIDGVSVRDARVYLRKCLHEMHVEAFGGPPATTHLAMVVHLDLDDEGADVLEVELEAVRKREAKRAETWE